MKLRMQEQFICYLLVAILFLVGIQVELPSADISFSYANEASVTNTTGSVISEGSKFVSIEKICTIDNLRRGVTTYVCGNKGRTLIRRFSGNVAVLLAAIMLLSTLFYSDNFLMCVSRKIAGSHVTIVRYIQRTDGKK